MIHSKFLNTIKFVVFTILSLILVFSAVFITVLNTYKPVVKAYINQEFIGYFSTKQHFDEVFNELVNEKQNVDSSSKVYLESEPTFETSYVRESLLKEQNVYTNLRSQIKTEYTIYDVLVNDEKKMSFENQDDANKYAKNLENEIANIDVKVKEEKTEVLNEITSEENANSIVKELIDEKGKPLNVKSDNTTIIASGIWPTTSRYVSSPYGWRWGTIHTGTDIAGKAGDPILAYLSGTVTYSGWASSYGNIVKIDHGRGLSTWYAHNSKLLVKVGQKVEQGQTIALMGSTGFSTGNHLHFEVRINGIHVNSYPYIQGK